MTISSISQPSIVEENQELIQIRLIALLCLYYNIHPDQLWEIQLSSIFYIKPYFCMKSGWENFLLILPKTYSAFLNKLILNTDTCEMKSCWVSVDNSQIRTYWYHNKNKPFLNILKNINHSTQKDENLNL